MRRDERSGLGKSIVKTVQEMEYMNAMRFCRQREEKRGGEIVQ